MFKALSVAALVTVAAAAPAHAVLQISSLINGVSFQCADGDACDLDGASGSLQIGPQNFSGVTLIGSLQEQEVGGVNFLNTSSLQLANNSGATASLAVAVGGTGFAGPVDIYTASGSTTFQQGAGSTIRLRFYGDPANSQGADTPSDTPGTLLADSGTFTALLRADATSYSSSGPFVDADAHSLTLLATGTLIDGGQIVNRGQTVLTQATPIPEPGTLALLGAALFGFGMLRRQMRPSA